MCTDPVSQCVENLATVSIDALFGPARVRAFAGWLYRQQQLSQTHKIAKEKEGGIDSYE